MKLRLYFITRLIVDIVLILPLVIYFKMTSATYSYNYFIVVGVLVLSELIILLKHIKNLYKKTIIECIEQIQDSQEVDFISHFNSQTRSFISYINTWKAANFLVKHMGVTFSPSMIPQYTYSKPQNREQQR